jgi:hypothetical protein
MASAKICNSDKALKGFSLALPILLFSRRVGTVLPRRQISSQVKKSTGMNPMDLKRGVEMAVTVVAQNLKKQTKKISRRPRYLGLGLSRPMAIRWEEEGIAAILWAAAFRQRTYGRYGAGRLCGVMSCKFAGTVNKETLIVIASSGRLCVTGPMTAGKSEECLLTLQSFQD